jgi:hypothetical protein
MPVFIPSVPNPAYVSRVDVAHRRHHARPNPFLGIRIGSESRYEGAIAKEQKYKTEYSKCKAKWSAKDPSKLEKKCAGEKRRWDKWAAKRKERATKVKDKLKRKGKLSPELDAELTRAATTTDIQKPVLSRPAQEALAVADAEVTAEDVALGIDDFEEEEESSSVLPIVAVVGGLVALGGFAWYMSRRKA